jgi:hypothetical protein
MSTTNTADQLETILSEIEDRAVGGDLFNRFFLENPLEYACLLHSLNLPDSIKAQLLALKVDMKPPYKSSDLAPLIEKAMAQLWERPGTGPQV